MKHKPIPSWIFKKYNKQELKPATGWQQHPLTIDVLQEVVQFLSEQLLGSWVDILFPVILWIEGHFIEL